MRSLLVLAVAACCAAPTAAQSADRRPMDHDLYDSWNSLQGQQLSDDGAWVLYSITPQLGDAVLHVRHTTGDAAYTVPRGAGGRFTEDAAYAVFTIKVELAAQHEAQREGRRGDRAPKDSLGILNLATGEIVRVERVKSFAVPEEGSGWAAYLLERERERPDSAEAEAPEAPEPPAEPEPATEEASQEEDEDEKEKEEGTTLVLRNLVTGEERRFDKVTEYAFDERGTHLAYAVSSKDGEGDGAYVVRLQDGTVTSLLTGEGVHKSLTFDEAGRQLAFLANAEDYEADQPAFTLYHWTAGRDAARALVTEGTAGVPAGWWVSEHGNLSFSESGRRLFFGTAPRPEPEPEEETPEWERVDVDVWNWRDPLLQPMQLVQRDDELKRSYVAVLDLRSGRAVQLADEDVPGVTVGMDGDADVAIANANTPYRQRISWDSPQFNDVYLINVNDGSRRMILRELQSRAELSPGARYVVWWDGHQRAYFTMPVAGGAPVNVSGAIPHPVWDELHDSPMAYGNYGDAGWTENDGSLLLYDRHDIWAVDPTGRRAPRSMTEGIGRERNLEFRYVRLDPEEDAISEDAPLLLHVFDRATKASGYARDRVRGTERPGQLLMEERSYPGGGGFGGGVRRADDADVLLYTQESFREFPDLWASGPEFRNPRRMSDANPQLAEYRLGSAELVHWRTSDGTLVDGLLFTPDDFDPSRQYPMMVYFYETMSDGLHRFQSPGPGGSSISVSFYVSRGYVVFIPDIHYRVGYPGESALDCVVTGVLSVLDRGFVDPARVGVQGHSWGGYQIAYLITQTNIFRAAEAGAPVANMTSAYGGIRWGTGMSRAFQYERTQSRIGGSLWEYPLRYIENSPLYWADKIQTPVLMMHNDEDTAVPWYQGIEFYTALRRLSKPVWLLNYNGEPHGLRKHQNRRDFQIRMQQFFDHYLMDAPPPVWLVEGVPAVEKGRTLGLDLREDPEP